MRGFIYNWNRIALRVVLYLCLRGLSGVSCCILQGFMGIAHPGAWLDIVDEGSCFRVIQGASARPSKKSR